MERLHLRNRSAGEQAADVNQFVGLRLRENALQAARAGALLHDEGYGEGAFELCGFDAAQQFDKRGGSETIADGSSGHSFGGQVHQAAIDYYGVENVHARLAHFDCGSCADIYVEIFEVRRFRRIGSAGLQMHREARDNAVYPLAGGGFDSHRLRGVHFVEDRRQAALWQALHAQIAIGRDFTDDEARLVYRSDDEAMRRAASDGDDHVAQIVRHRVELFQARANLICQLTLVPGDGGRVDKVFQLVLERSVSTFGYL